MVAVSIPTFGGMVPALDDRKLPDTAATHAENIWVYGGSLTGIRKPRKLRNVPVGTQKSFRIPRDLRDTQRIFNDSLWLDFQNPNTDVIRAPTFGDVHDRYYWASDNFPPMYNTRQRIEQALPPLRLGIPEPLAAPTVTPPGSGGTAISRVYVVTYVSEYGEESAPSPPALVTGPNVAGWTVGMPSPTADQNLNRRITKKRLYRTITSSSGTATFFMVGEYPVATASITDNVLDTALSANAQLESFAWTPPPEDLQGFTQMPNGIIASWRDNELWFSEPYRPHAWPAAYVLTVPYPIVGLGIVGQTLVVCTAGFPITASGVSPAYITTSNLTTFEPCTSRQSILSTPEGVYYSSPNGLVLVNPGIAENITRELVTVDRWQSLAPALFKAGRYGTAYYAFGALTGDVFADAFSNAAFVDIDYSGAQRGVMIDPKDIRVGFTFVMHPFPVAGVMNDQWSGELMIIWNNELHWIDSAQQDPVVTPYKWRSKEFHGPLLKNLGAVKVYYTIPRNTPEQSPVRNVAPDQTLAEGQHLLLRIYADGKLVVTREVRESGELLRIPSGFKADFWQLELEGRVNVVAAHMASTAKELRNV